MYIYIYVYIYIYIIYIYIYNIYIYVYIPDTPLQKQMHKFALEYKAKPRAQATTSSKPFNFAAAFKNIDTNHLAGPALYIFLNNYFKNFCGNVDNNNLVSPALYGNRCGGVCDFCVCVCARVYMCALEFVKRVSDVPLLCFVCASTSHAWL